MSSSLADASRARGGILKESTAMAYMPQEDAQRQAVAAKQDYWFLKTLSTRIVTRYLWESHQK